MFVIVSNIRLSFFSKTFLQPWKMRYLSVLRKRNTKLIRFHILQMIHRDPPFQQAICKMWRSSFLCRKSFFLQVGKGLCCVCQVVHLYQNTVTIKLSRIADFLNWKETTEQSMINLLYKLHKHKSINFC